MGTALNIRDIGADRKAALEEEAKRRGVSAAEVVRHFIDEGLNQTRRDRERREWMAAGQPGIEAERALVEKQGPTLARFRRIDRTER